jgi:hypothetical protein
VKGKLFEAAQRTAQLGGDHARFAAVSFYADPETIREELEENGWEGYDTAESFGKDDIRNPDRLVDKVRDWMAK